MMENAVATRRNSSRSRLPKKVKDAFVKVLELSKKQKRYFVSYVATITTYNTESGATELRDLMKAIKETGTELGYIGARSTGSSPKAPIMWTRRPRSTRCGRS